MANLIAYELLPRIFNMSVTAGIVILFVLLARLLLRRAPKVFSYALWSVVLFRLLCPVSLSAGFSLLGLVDMPTRAATPHTTTVEYAPPDIVHAEDPQVQFPVEPVRTAVNEVLPKGEEQTTADPLEAPTAIATWLWLLGILAMAAYSVASYLKIRRRLVGAVPLRDNIYLADHIPTPFVMGLFRPRIYLPSALSGREQAYIIRHEQHHIRRGDHIVKVLSFAALCIHWFNPLVWAAFFLSGKDMEMSCDEAVVHALGEQIRADYSTSLLRLATGRRRIAGMPLAFGEGDTKSRIRNLVNWKTPKRWAVLLAAVVCIAVAGACAANPQGSTRGRYDSMEDFSQQTMDAVKTTVYYTAEGGEATAAVTGTKLAWLEQQGEVDGLAPEGALEAWTFHFLVQVDADDIMLVGGMYEEDGWYDLEGQGGHNVVALRYDDGSYDVLYDQAVNDNLDFYGYHNSYEEAIYDWYVDDQGLDLPLYVEDWTGSIGAPAENLGNFPVHRCDREGWYLYIPVQAWQRAGRGDSWQSGYGTGSALTVYRQDQDARTQADYLVSQGWIAVEGTVPHVRHWEYDIEDYYYNAPDGGSYQVRIEWQAQNIAGSPYTAIEPDVLRAMAESFTVDEETAPLPTPTPEATAGPLGGVQRGAPLTLCLTRNGDEIGTYDDCWSESNAVYYFNYLQTLSWAAAEENGPYDDRDAVTLSGADGWTMTAYDGADEVCFSDPAGTRWLKPEMEDDSAYEMLRGWFDEAEYTALGGGYDHQSIVVPDVGQGYLEAAAVYVDAFERIHLQASAGSKLCYSFVLTSVEEAEEATSSMRERGEIDERTYCFYLTTVFVPQNEYALGWSMAGNTGDYTGEDPAVPEGALEYYRCGYITLEDDGWHGRLVGTGW